jgi:hypothetical protein
MLSRRRFVGEVLGGLLVTGVAGCAANPTSTFGLASASLSGKSRSPDEYPMSTEQIAKLPYATLGVRVAKYPRAVVVLATIDGQELQWVSADRVSFYTSNGWLMRTHGLQRDLGATRWVEGAGDPLRSFVQTGTVPARGVYREIDLRHEDEKAIAIESRFELVRDETIVIQGREHLTHRIDERADMRDWRWQVRNSFWVDAQSGLVRRSVQRYCPEMPPIELEVLKPAAM